MTLNKDDKQETFSADIKEMPDFRVIEQVKEIFLLFGHTLSAMKLFPFHHSTFKNFVENFDGKLAKFLEAHEQLEVEVEESSFLYGGEVVYRDEKIIKSLPYFFFKDGIRNLSFHRGLTRKEIDSFLEILKQESSLPPEESDIVIALWERDFENIRYFAPDAFLETKLEVIQESLLDKKIDKDKLHSGYVQLRPEDMEDILKKKLVLDLKKQTSSLEISDLVASLDKNEMALIESMLEAERKTPPEQEFLDLFFELIVQEDKIDQLPLMLDFIEKHHQTLIKQGDFFYALILLNYIQDLKNIFHYQSPAKAIELEKFLRKIREKTSTDFLKESMASREREDSLSFFNYLKFFGPRMIQLVAELFEEEEESDVHAHAFDFLYEMAQKDLSLVVNLAQEQRPKLSKAVIAILTKISDRKAIPYFGVFRNFTNKSIKLEVIQALGNIEDVMAQKILLSFTLDDDEEVRTAALERLQYLNEKNILMIIHGKALRKDFYKKSIKEKRAVLNFLGRSRTEEAATLLQSILKKSSLFSRARVLATRLAAVQALELMGTPQSHEILKKGTRFKNRKVRRACCAALERISTPNIPSSSSQEEER